MIHYNGNKGKSSPMFSRRPRGYIHSLIILFLLLCVVYLLYLNNSLQDQVAQLNIQIISHEGQHESLLKEIQDVKSDKAKVEYNCGAERTKLQSKINDLKKEEDDAQSAMQAEIEKCAGNFEELKLHHDDVESGANQMQDQLSNALAQKNALDMENEKLRLNDISLSNDISLLRDDKERLLDKLKQLQDDKTHKTALDRKMTTMQKELSNYGYLRNLFKKLGAGVVDIEHENFKALSSTEQRLLLGYFGNADNSSETDHLTDQSSVLPNAGVNVSQNEVLSVPETSIALGDSNQTMAQNHIKENVSTNPENSAPNLTFKNSDSNQESIPGSEILNADLRNPKGFKSMEHESNPVEVANSDDVTAPTSTPVVIQDRDEALEKLKQLEKRRENIDKETLKDIRKLVVLQEEPRNEHEIPPKDRIINEQDQDKGGEISDDTRIEKNAEEPDNEEGDDTEVENPISNVEILDVHDINEDDVDPEPEEAPDHQNDEPVEIEEIDE